MACALKLAPIVFVRPVELRKAEWSEFDLAGKEWRIPAAKMKMREEHVVPLSRQAVALLKDLYPLTGPDARGRDDGPVYVFPSIREHALNAALRRLGYSQEEMTAHGFRAIASTLLHEFGRWPSHVIERQLAHAERNKVRAAYNKRAQPRAGGAFNRDDVLVDDQLSQQLRVFLADFVASIERR